MDSISKPQASSKDSGMNFEFLFLRAHSRSRAKIIFSFDDAIYAGHEDVSTLNHPLLYRWKHGRGYDEVIRACDHVIAGNPQPSE